MKILVAEDDFTSRMLMQSLLKEYGEIHTVMNGKEAVAAYRMSRYNLEPYDLICLDVMMPEMDGHQVLREIRKQEEEETISRVPIIMTSALNDKDAISEATTSGCDGYILKPIQKQRLIQVMQKLGLI